MLWPVAWAQRSRALPERPHLKQWKVCCSRLTEKQRLVPDVEPCKGHGPRCWRAVAAAELEAEQLQDGGHGDQRRARRRSRWQGVKPVRAGAGLAAGLRVVAWRRSRASASLRSRSAKISLVAAVELVLGRDVADGAVQADGVVMVDVIGHDAAGVVQRQRHLDADAVALEGLVPAFDLAVALRIVRRGSDMGHAADADELLEVLGDELRAVVGDDARRDAGVSSRGRAGGWFPRRFPPSSRGFPSGR